MDNNVDSDIRELKRDMQRAFKILEGNGKPGLIQQVQENENVFEKFMAVWESREKDKMKFDDRQEKKFNRLITIIGLFVAVMSVILGILTYEHATGHAVLKLNSDIYNSQYIVPNSMEGRL